MELRRLDKYKEKFKEFSESINDLQQYLSGHSKNPAEQSHAISAHEISEVLHIQELDALFLLSLAEKEHLLNRVYKVFTEDDTFLGDFPNNSSIPQKLVNDSTGETVDRNNLIVDLVFEVGE